MKMPRTILLTATLVLAFALCAPAFAGPQNGEVNHAREKTQYCEGKAPPSLWDVILCYPYVDLLIELMPLELLFPDSGDSSSD